MSKIKFIVAKWHARADICNKQTQSRTDPHCTRRPQLTTPAIRGPQLTTPA